MVFAGEAEAEDLEVESDGGDSTAGLDPEGRAVIPVGYVGYGPGDEGVGVPAGAGGLEQPAEAAMKTRSVSAAERGEEKSLADIGTSLFRKQRSRP